MHLVACLIVQNSCKGLVWGFFFPFCLLFLKRKQRSPTYIRELKMKAQLPIAFCKPIPISLHSFGVKGSNGRLTPSVPDFCLTAAGSSGEHPKDTAHLSQFLCPVCGNAGTIKIISIPWDYFLNNSENNSLRVNSVFIQVLLSAGSCILPRHRHLLQG